MTVEVYSVPVGWTSSRFTATVGGAAAGVWGYTRTTEMATVAWSAGQSVEISFVKFGSDATTEVRITRLAGSVTSYKVYPENSGHTASLDGGVLVLQVPTGVHLHVECNGDRANVICVFATPLKPALPSPRTNFGTALATISSLNIGTGEFTTAASHGLTNNQRVRISTSGSLPTPSTGTLGTFDILYATVTAVNKFTLSRTLGGSTVTYSAAGSSNSIYTGEWTNASTALYFPAGVHYIGRMFWLSDDVEVYIDGGAILLGSFDLRDSQGVTIDGRGVMAGTFATHATVVALPTFNEQLEYSMLLGYDGTHFTYNNSVSGITIMAYPWYCTHEGVKSWTNVQLISPWNYNCDGFDCSEQSVLANAGTVTDCYAFVGDDALKCNSQWFEMTATRVFTVTSNAGNVLFSYWGEENAGNYQRVIDCHGMSLSEADGDDDPNDVTTGADAIFKLWVDQDEATMTEGCFNVVVENYHVWGRLASRLFAIQNIPYPQAALRGDTHGQIANIRFDGLYVQQEPEQLAVLRGFNWRNAPNDIAFTDWTIADVPVTVRNWSDYVTSNAYAYNITVGGSPVVTKVDLVNLALSHIGEGITVTSLSPPDDSAAAIAAARFWDSAVRQALGSFAWPFATTRAELVEASTNELEDSFSYCYELPSDYVRALELLPLGAKDNYVLSDGQPVPFQLETCSDGVQRIYTDLEDAWLRYTIFVSDPNKWTAQFQQAFVWHLASILAGNLVKGKEGMAVRQTLEQRAYIASNMASADAATSRSVTPEHRPAWFKTGTLQVPPARISRP